MSSPQGLVDASKASSREFDVLCLGETMIMVTPNPGGHLDLQSTFILRPGGAESNVASLIAALGHRAAWAGHVGTDPFGDMVLSALRNASVDVALAHQVVGHPTGVYFKDPRPLGTSVHYYRSGSAASQMSPSLIDKWAGVDARLLHLSGITPALSPTCRDLVRTLVYERPLPRTVVSFDVNYREALWARTDAATELLELAQASDVVFVGRDEAENLWGTRTAEEIRDILHKPAHVVVKDGAIEAVAFHGDEVVRVDAPRVRVVEAVGAGDAFAAGWLSGVLSNHDAIGRLRFAHLIASRVLQSPSDSAPVPSPAEIAPLLRTDPPRWQTHVPIATG